MQESGFHAFLTILHRLEQAHSYVARSMCVYVCVQTYRHKLFSTNIYTVFIICQALLQMLILVYLMPKTQDVGALTIPSEEMETVTFVNCFARGHPVSKQHVQDSAPADSSSLCLTVILCCPPRALLPSRVLRFVYIHMCSCMCMCITRQQKGHETPSVYSVLFQLCNMLVIPTKYPHPPTGRSSHCEKSGLRRLLRKSTNIIKWLLYLRH